jgi:predicted transcriptional regulator
MRRATTPRDIPPPLEMLCLKALWSLGEGNVADVREAVAAAKPLAYTTVLTILDRLAKKNVVTRHKVGRAFVYAPRISRDAIRQLALKEFVDCFFEGSEQRLVEFVRRPREEESPSEIEVDIGGELDAALL